MACMLVKLKENAKLMKEKFQNTCISKTNAINTKYYTTN